MPFSPESIEQNPHNICVSCPHIGVDCDGPNFLAMSVERWCEWCHLRKDYLRWTHAVLSEKANVSKVSIDRIMSGDVKDLRITTMQAVTKALVNGSWGTSPCILVAETAKEIEIDNPVLVAQCTHLQNQLTTLTEEFKAERDSFHEEARKKVEFLRRQIDIKDKHIELLYSLIENRR